MAINFTTVVMSEDTTPSHFIVEAATQNPDRNLVIRTGWRGSELTLIVSREQARLLMLEIADALEPTTADTSSDISPNCEICATNGVHSLSIGDGWVTSKNHMTVSK